ncbi:hypothetical protein J7337_012989 [Fusarium musae]|uniref:Transaldolase n=1 Tax=Fusarium musae TaxID=1042133 RepID=A0A9P8IHW2_9HYPO|nr:hypothetical protein J7337_012989 [Fusarium musae]KAG9496401.1 hypothetical protein J7337_012989 [Fusarium musae]
MTPQTENSFLHEIEQKTLQDPSNAEVINATAFELQDQGFLAILSRLAVHLCKRNINLIKGRVLVQTNPSAAYSYQETLDHARLYASEFEKAGIPKTRYCVKIMATGPGLKAAKILRDEGISTLGTGVFSVVQAVACSQAGCLYISPYYNAYRISFRSYKEVLASAELGCHSATISQDLLGELKTLAPGEISLPVTPRVAAMKSPYSDDVPIPSPRLSELLTRDLHEEKECSMKGLTLDLLADGGKELEQALVKDSEAARMVKEALEMFIYCEKETKKLIKGTAVVASL